MTPAPCSGCESLAVRVAVLEREHADLASEALLSFATAIANRPDLVNALVSLGRFAEWFMQTRKYLAAIFSLMGIALAYLGGVLTGAATWWPW